MHSTSSPPSSPMHRTRATVLPSLPFASWPTSNIIPQTTYLDQTRKGAGAICGKVYHIWNSLPKAVKIPLESAAIYNWSADWRIKAPAAAILALSELPLKLIAFLGGSPMNFKGERYRLSNDFSSDDAGASLAELDRKIGKFESTAAEAAHLSVRRIPSAKPQTQPISSAAAAKEMVKATDQELVVLIEKISDFGILQAMHWVSCPAEQDSSSRLLRIVDCASRRTDGKKPSIWKLFLAHLGKELSWWGKLKAGFVYLFVWKWIPIIPNTVDAYLKNILKELRSNLKDNGENRIKFINGILEDGDNLLEIYNGATETYATDGARKGNLNRYRKAAIDLHLPMHDNPDPGASPEKIRTDFFQKLSCSIVDDCAPIVPFRFFQSGLNWLIRRQLRNHILPEVFLNISNEKKQAAQRNKIPFFLALTKTLTAQISRMQEKLAPGSFDAPPLPAKHFEGIVKKWMRAIDLSECNTPDEVRTRCKELETRQNTGIDAGIRQGVQQGIQKGMAVLFDYLSKSENTEKLFAILFKSLGEPLSGKLPMTEKEWQEMTTEYEGAKIFLKQAASSLLKEILQEVVLDQVHGGKRPEAAGQAAEKIFSTHKHRGIEAFDEIQLHCHRICNRIQENKVKRTSLSTIHPELIAISSVLKALENEERVKITLEQDPPPRIAALPKADRDSILKTLYPLYEGSNRIIDFCARLQELQRKQTDHRQFIQELESFRNRVKEMLAKNDLSALFEKFKQIKKLGPSKEFYRNHFENSMQCISESQAEFVKERRIIEAIDTLQLFPSSDKEPIHLQSGLIGQLALFAQGTPPPRFQKRKAIEQIRNHLNTIPFRIEDQQRITNLLQWLDQYPNLPHPHPHFNEVMWPPLKQLFHEQKARSEETIQRISSRLRSELIRMHQKIDEQVVYFDAIERKNGEEMSKEAIRLQAEAEHLYTYISLARKEEQLHLSDQELGQIGGLAGIALGSASAWAGSAIGSSLGGHIGAGLGGAIGAFAAYGMNNLDKLAAKQVRTFTIKSLISASLGGVASALAASQGVAFLTPSLIGAASASAGLEYALFQSTQRAFGAGMKIALSTVVDMFNKTYDHMLTNDLLLDSLLKIFMRQTLSLFPSKT